MQGDVTLKPCAHCGHDANIIPYAAAKHIRFCAQCENDGCGLKTNSFSTEAEAIAAWNQRADPQGEPVACYYCRDDQHGVATADGGFRCPNCKRTWGYTQPPAQDVEALVSALRNVPIPGLTEPMPDFSERMNRWLNNEYRTALASFRSKP